MPTNKNRVAGYLPDDVNERFKAFAHEQGLSESKAITLILSEYLGVSQNIAHKVAHQAVTRAEFDELSEKVAQLSELLYERSDLKGEPPDDIVCPSCGSTKLIKAGRTRHGKQRHQCKECGKHFTLS